MTHSGADASTRLAVDRTRLAYERTMMAWVRTATSLISFGFTIYKFFQYQSEHGQVGSNRLLGPREFAMLMIVAGIASLVLATIEQRRQMKSLRETYKEVPYSLAVILAAVIGLLGVFALLAVSLDQ